MAGGEAPLESTWRAARIWIPGASLSPPQASALTGRMDALERRLERLPAASVPVVVYAHDCAGLGSEATTWGELLASQGYAVIAPDGFAHGGRTPTCAPGDVNALLARESEIRYALRQVRTALWVRQRAVFVLGVGQGATVGARGAVGAVVGTVALGGAAGAPGVSPVLVRERRDPPSDEDRRAVVEFLRRLTPP